MREEYLLAALRMGAGADPVPESVSAAARAVFGLRVPGGVPAGPVDLPAPPGTRSAPAAPPVPGRAADTPGAEDTPGADGPGADGPGADEASGAARGERTERWPGGAAGVRRFRADGLVIDVEASVTGGRMEVAGQVSPAPGPDARVEVRTPHVAKVRVPSGSGHFAVADLPPGWVSVVCHRPGQAPVFTRWIHVRP